jgi:hypothetical protein
MSTARFSLITWRRALSGGAIRRECGEVFGCHVQKKMLKSCRNGLRSKRPGFQTLKRGQNRRKEVKPIIPNCMPPHTRPARFSLIAWRTALSAIPAIGGECGEALGHVEERKKDEGRIKKFWLASGW